MLLYGEFVTAHLHFPSHDYSVIHSFFQSGMLLMDFPASCDGHLTAEDVTECGKSQSQFDRSQTSSAGSVILPDTFYFRIKKL